MAGFLSGDPAHIGMFEGGSYKHSHDKIEENGGLWYFSRKEIEENSPSRRDGIDLKKETYLRKSYCTFLQDLGMRLKVPQVTIATAIIFCHRFFLRQSHAKHDRRTVATVCMFLAGKVEETPRPLKDVILVSYEIIHKKDPEAIQRIKQKEFYEQQKESTLIVERIVLGTLGFDFNVHHPYKPLVDSIKKFKVAQNALAQVAWNFVNDGLRTSLCLQFKPHHIAAGAIFLAAKFLKVKLPSDGERVWWQEFDVTPRQLEEVSNQMLELYEQNRVPPSQTSEVVEGSTGGGVTQMASSRSTALDEDHAAINSNSQGVVTSRSGASNVVSSRLPPDHNSSYPGNSHSGPPKASQNRSNEEAISSVQNRQGDGEINDNYQNYEPESLPQSSNRREAENEARYGSEGHGEEARGKSVGKSESRDLGSEYKDKHHGRNLESSKDGKQLGQSPHDAIKKIDKDKVKAALEKRKKSRPDVARRTDFMDDDDLIERELEDGIELAAESEKTKRHSWSRSSNQPDHHENEDEQYHASKGQSSHSQDLDHVEEGELGAFEDADRGYRSPRSSSRKRKAVSPPEKPFEGKQHNNHPDYPEDRSRLGRNGYSERDHKRHIQENHV